MDIAKYIGLFLLKNHFCYIHGLGNLELKKKPASFDGQALQSPQFTVHLTPTGSIDDTLANFIATNEMTSISKASNSLREFSIQSRTELEAGKEVVIPAIGKFVSESGKIRFITDPYFQQAPPPVPVHHTVNQKEEAQARKSLFAKKDNLEPPPENISKSGSINWGKIVIWLVIVGLVTTAVIMGVRMIPERFNTGSEEDTVKAVVMPVKDTAIQNITETKPDSSQMAKTDSNSDKKDSVNSAPSLADQHLIHYKVLLNTYGTLFRAQKRVEKLTGFGNKVELVTKDSSTYYIVMPISSAAADTSRVKDSLRRAFNPEGVRIIR